METKIPEHYAARFAELVGLTDAFCDEHLDAEYKKLCREMAACICHDDSPVR